MKNKKNKRHKEIKSHKYGTVGYLVDILLDCNPKAKLEFATASGSLDILSFYPRELEKDESDLSKSKHVVIDLGDE